MLRQEPLFGNPVLCGISIQCSNGNITAWIACTIRCISECFGYHRRCNFCDAAFRSYFGFQHLAIPIDSCSVNRQTIVKAWKIYRAVIGIHCKSSCQYEVSLEFPILLGFVIYDRTSVYFQAASEVLFSCDCL